MKREILFRAKRKDNGEWIYGYPIIDNADCSLKAEGKCECPHDGSHADLFYWLDRFHEYEGMEVDAETIGQYIGMVDTNGVKIFEGDVVRLTFSGAIGEIVCAINYFFRINAFGKTRNYPITDYSSEHIEVVGNVYDNQELLDEQKK